MSGQTQVRSDSRYLGMSHEVQLHLKTDYSLQLVGGLGWERWQREIRNPLGNDQLEDFDIAYLRLGLKYRFAFFTGLQGGGGVKYPFIIHEDAHFKRLGGLNNPTLKPESKLGYYAHLDYQPKQTDFNWTAYYETYQFGRSPGVSVNMSGSNQVFVQPKSEMRLLGIKAMYDLK